MTPHAPALTPGEATRDRHAFLRRVVDSPSVEAILGRLRTGRASVLGGCGSSPALLAGALALRAGRMVLHVVAHLDEADDALEDLELFAQADLPVATDRLCALEMLPGESGVNLELLAQRLALVERVTRREMIGPAVVVAPVQALMQCVPEPGVMAALSRTIAAGAELPPGELLDWLDRAGYERVDAVESPGQFATRGGIIDLFAPAGGGNDAVAGPVRLDYFGDTIESIRLIDPDTMGSTRAIERVQVVGASTQTLLSDEQSTSFHSLLPEEALICLNEPIELSEQARGYYERLTNPRGIVHPAALLRALTERAHLAVHHYGTGESRDAVQLPVQPIPTFDHDAARAVTELGALARTHEVVVLCQKDAERQRLAELVQEHAGGAAITLEVGYLHRGFVWDEGGAAAEGSASGALALVPHHELFHRYNLPGTTGRRLRVVAAAATRPSDAFLDLSVGDYVVHADHGIARFAALRTMTRNGKTEEYLTLEFADNALLHVPATQIELVQKYVGGFKGRPPLSLLGGKRWAKQKRQVEESVKDLAAQMLRLQAARASQPGLRFPPDTHWQREFEAEFPFEETQDQLAAISEVKKDMSDEQPMDRLICGDVGFGKTEVAIRAAFKAVEFGKQVAVLVPTTVLAEQHERTFRGRLADYPFRVESLSRFKTDAQQRQTLEDLAAGRVDVVIGTHRLLSGDVRFADLGLVIVDEEQRFGVEHKHQLLQFRLTADVLTLSATPIPRTLHMAMLGLRDISSLSTPPLDRRAIVTEVIPFERGRIKQAILREMSRDGQVYFVHNRVHNIQAVADDVQKLVPEARIIIGHGQMPPRKLEEVMLSFVRREADVLVCTTIIESGIDIPTANTMFINQADIFGLADLHQLRGRVGRYKHRAYCYLLLPEDRPITDTATRRLKAIEQYTMLGAGFKIAMRDLEIRGAGNLLGKEQSGHIAAVGYDMYCRLLEHAAKRLRHESVLEPATTHVELPIAGRLPRSYIPSDKFRMEAYRRLTRAASADELDRVVRDLEDAYGKPPELAQLVIELAELRIAATARSVESLKLDGADVILRTAEPRKLSEHLRHAQGRVSVIDDRTVYYRPPANYLQEPRTLLTVLRKLLRAPRDDQPSNTSRSDISNPGSSSGTVRRSAS